jgi:hypothetical protein
VRILVLLITQSDTVNRKSNAHEHGLLGLETAHLWITPSGPAMRITHAARCGQATCRAIDSAGFEASAKQASTVIDHIADADRRQVSDQGRP